MSLEIQSDKKNCALYIIWLIFSLIMEVFWSLYIPIPQDFLISPYLGTIIRLFGIHFQHAIHEYMTYEQSP